MTKIIRGDGSLLALEAVFIIELAPIINTKDWYRSSIFTLKFNLLIFIYSSFVKYTHLFLECRLFYYVFKKKIT